MDNKWIVFASGLVAGLIVGVVMMSAFSGPTGGSAPSGAPAPVTPGQQPQQQGPDPVKIAADIRNLEAIVQQDPANYEAWKTLGDRFFDSDQPQKSVDAYRRALALNGVDPNVWTDMGVMYRELKNPQEAINAFRKAASLSPTHPQSRMNLGVVYMHDLNDTKAAIEAWEDYLRAVPNAPNAEQVRMSIAELRSRSAGTSDLDKAAQELGQKLNQPAAK